MNMRALEIRESTSGIDHPHVAVIVNGLVEIYHTEGNIEKPSRLLPDLSEFMSNRLARASLYGL